MAPATVLWTETEINLLIEAWSELDVQFPTARCKRGTGTYRKKLFVLFSRRTTYPRTFSGINHIQYALRDYALFVHQFDSDRQRDGGHSWYDLKESERQQYRAEVPHNSRGVMSAVGRETFGRLMQMERAQKWIGGVQVAEAVRQGENASLNSGVTPPVKSYQPVLVPNSPEDREQFSSVAEVHEYSPLSESETPNTEQDAEMELAAQDLQSRDTSSQVGEISGDGVSPFIYTSPAVTASASSRSNTESNSAVSPPTNNGTVTKAKSSRKKRKTSKHRDCNILLENMMELQNRQIRRSIRKLRAGIEGEVRRSTEMLRSIITNQFDDPNSSGDVAFVTRVLEIQDQQLKERFDRFEENRTSEEIENRAMLGQRFNSQN